MLDNTVESDWARSIALLKRSERIPLSFAQQRMWFLAQMEGVNSAYLIPFWLRLKGDLDQKSLRLALDRILARHEALRTTFVLVDRELVQKISSATVTHFNLIEHDLRGNSEMQAEVHRLAALETSSTFALEAGPLVRGRLIRVAEDEHVLLITMHHIVSDGWSIGIFTRELIALYSAFRDGKRDSLPILDFQYADYTVWQRAWIEGGGACSGRPITGGLRWLELRRCWRYRPIILVRRGKSLPAPSRKQFWTSN